MKKILCLIIAVTLLFCSNFTTMAQTTKNDLADALNLFGAMGLVETGEDVSVELTRAEFAFRVAQFIGVNVHDNDSQNYFSDVNDIHWAKTAINYLAANKYIVGNGGAFRPDDAITGMEALKILLSISGYASEAEARGGYPNGYQRTAMRLKITSGVNIMSPLTAGDYWMLLYRVCQLNYLETEAIQGENITYSSVGTKTVLGIYHDIYYAKGQLKAVGQTSIEEGKSCDKDSVIVGDETYKNENTNISFYSYLGQEIEIYYKDNGSDEKSVICVLEQRGNNEIITIYHTDFNRVVDNGSYYTIEYYDSNKKARNIKIDRGAIVIKNGVSVETNVLDALDLKHGYITFYDSAYGKQCEVVCVYDGYDMVIGNINNENSDVVVGTHAAGQWYTMRGEVGEKVIIYDKYNSSLWVDISPDDDKVIVLRNATGAAIGYESLAVGDVVTVFKSDDNSHIDVVKGMGSIKGILGAVTDEEYYVSDKEYKVTDVCKTNHADEIKIGMEAKFVLNPFGEISYIEPVSSSTVKIAYLVDMHYEKSLGKELLNLKFFTIDGEMKVLEVSEKVTVDATKYKELEDVIGKISKNGEDVTPQVVRFDTDIDGKVNYIDLAGPVSGESENTLVKSGETTGMYHSPAKKIVSMPACIFDGTKTKIMVVPSGISTGDYIDEAFGIKKIADLTSGNSYSVTTYRVGVHSDYEDVIVMKRDNEWGGAASTTLSLIESIRYGIDENGCDVGIVTAYSTGQTPKTFYTENPSILSNLKTGDLAWLMFGINGKITELKDVMYKADEGKTFEGNTAIFGGTNREDIVESTSLGAAMYLESVYAYEVSGNVLRYGYEIGEINGGCYLPTDVYVVDTSNGRTTVHFADKSEIADYIRAGVDCSRLLIRSTTYTAKQVYIYK